LINRIPDDGFNGDFHPDFEANDHKKDGPMNHMGTVVGAYSDNKPAEEFKREGKNFQSSGDGEGPYDMTKKQIGIAEEKALKKEAKRMKKQEKKDVAKREEEHERLEA